MLLTHIFILSVIKRGALQTNCIQNWAFIISVLKVEYQVGLVFSISNFLLIKFIRQIIRVRFSCSNSALEGLLWQILCLDETDGCDAMLCSLAILIRVSYWQAFGRQKSLQDVAKYILLRYRGGPMLVEIFIISKVNIF